MDDRAHVMPRRERRHCGCIGSARV